MSSNRRFLVAIVCALTLGACTKLGFGEKIPAAEPMKVRGGETACLNEGGKVIEDYIAGRTGADSLEEMYQCVDTSIQLFLDRTRTSTPGVYQPIELRNFIEKFFIGRNIVSNALMAETMEFKKSILGGRGDMLTANELRSLRRIMKALKDALVRLDKYRPLTIANLANLDTSAQNEVLARINSVASDFGTEISLTAGDYSMSRLESLLKEFERVFPGDGLKNFIVRFPLIRMFKPVLFGTSADEFRGEEWPRFLKAAARILGIYIKTQPLYPDETGKFPVLTCGKGLERFNEAGLEFLRLLDEAVANHGSLQMIPLLELGRVVDALDPSDLPGVRRLSIKKFLRPVVQNLLAGDTEGALGRDADGITSLSVEHARRYFLDWVDGQKYIEGLFSQLGQFDCQGDIRAQSAYSLKELESVSVEAAMGVRHLEDLDPRTMVAVQKLRRLIQSRKPMMDSSGVRVLLDSYRPRTKFFYADLLQINWSSLVFSVSQQGYRLKRYDPIRKEFGDPEAATVEELEAFYNDLLELGADLKLADPTQWDAARMRFRDGNLFMPSSNGDMKLMGAAESTELIAVMVSSKAISVALHEGGLKACRSIPGGIFDTRMVESKCLVENMERELESYLSNLPALVRYIREQKPADRQKFFDLILDVSVIPSDHSGFIAVNELDRLGIILHYIELIYSSFDADYSGTLNTSETLIAFKRFESVLRDLLKGNAMDRDGLRALFTYMLSRGKPPETALEKADYLYWKLMGPKRWKMAVERPMILKVLAKLSFDPKPADSGSQGQMSGQKSSGQ